MPDIEDHNVDEQDKLCAENLSLLIPFWAWAMLNPKPRSRVRLAWISKAQQLETRNWNKSFAFCGVFEEADGDGDKSEQVDEYEEAAPATQMEKEFEEGFNN